jgi:hypothetical protein
MEVGFFVYFFWFCSEPGEPVLVFGATLYLVSGGLVGFHSEHLISATWFSAELRNQFWVQIFFILFQVTVHFMREKNPKMSK